MELASEVDGAAKGGAEGASTSDAERVQEHVQKSKIAQIDALMATMREQKSAHEAKEVTTLHILTPLA